MTSSPRFAQSNGEVERGVQTMKAILNKCDDEYFALLTYRNTPLHNGCTPAQLSMGRRLKTRVPIHPVELIPRLPDLDLVRKRERRNIARQWRRTTIVDILSSNELRCQQEIECGSLIYRPRGTSSEIYKRHDRC